MHPNRFHRLPNPTQTPALAVTVRAVADAHRSSASRWMPAIRSFANSWTWATARTAACRASMSFFFRSETACSAAEVLASRTRWSDRRSTASISSAACRLTYPRKPAAAAAAAAAA